MTDDVRRRARTHSRPPTASVGVRPARLARRAGRSATSSACPHTVRILLENLLRRAGTRDVSDDDVRGARRVARARRGDVAFMPARVLMQDFTGVPAVVDLAAMRSAVARAGGDPDSGEPARAGRPRHRPLGAGRPVPHAGGLRGEHRLGVPAQRRAVRAAPLGAAGLRRRPRGAAGRRHLPPGEPRAPRPGRRGPRRRGVPRHARRDRLAHHDDQRPRRAGLGRRRDRGRGRDARASRCSCRSRSWSASGSPARCRPGRPRPTSC